MSIFARLRNLGRTDALTGEIDRELAFHIEERADDLVAAGMSREAAIREAHRRLGGRTYQREQTRDADVVTWIDTVGADLRYALRALGRSPAFTVAAVASLALGIGANTTIFTLTNAVVLRPLPVASPEHLMLLSADTTEDAGYTTNPIWEQVRDRQRTFTTVAAFGQTRFNLASGGEARRVAAEWVSGDYFRVMGLAPAAGRLIAREDDQRGCAGTVVLGHDFWRSEFGGTNDAVGATLRLDGKVFRVIGVAPRGYFGMEVGRKANLFVPLCAEALINEASSSLDRRTSWWIRMVGRRDSTVAVADVNAGLGALAPEVYAATIPNQYSQESQREYVEGQLHALPIAGGTSNLRDRYRTALMVLMGGVALVLLIACANVANLLLARAAARQRELAIRLAIGAGRLRLIRQMLTESLLLAGLGATLGLLLSVWGTRSLVSIISRADDPVSIDLSLDGQVLLFTVAVSTLTAIVFGLLPAWRAARVDPQAAMKANARGVVEGGSRFGLGKTLVGAQVALSLVLVVAAGLLVGTLRTLATEDHGFEPDRVLLVSVDMRRANGVDSAARVLAAADRDRMLDRVRGITGVEAASTSDLTPVGNSRWNEEVFVDGFRADSARDRISWFNEVSPGYFATLGTRLLAGRDFQPTDTRSSGPVAIISEAAARHYFHTDRPVGRQYRTRIRDTLSDPVTVIGIVENSKYSSLRDEPTRLVYLSASQQRVPGFGFALSVRTAGDPTALVPVVRSALASVSPGSILDFVPFSTQLAQSLRRERLLATLSALFGALALGLAMLGLYGVMSYAVTRRRNELGVRLALGAGRERIVRMVMLEITWVVTAGVVAGAIVAWMTSRFVDSFLYRVDARDPRVFAASALLLLIVALAAGFAPAWRAGRVDPIDALREQ